MAPRRCRRSEGPGAKQHGDDSALLSFFSKSILNAAMTVRVQHRVAIVDVGQRLHLDSRDLVHRRMRVRTRLFSFFEDQLQALLFGACSFLLLTAPRQKSPGQDRAYGFVAICILAWRRRSSRSRFATIFFI